MAADGSITETLNFYNDNETIYADSLSYIGNECSGGDTPFKGTIDDVYIYNRCLSSSEIDELLK